MPQAGEHTHTVNIPKSGGHTHESNYEGKGTAKNIEPPFYMLIYIIKVI